MRLFLSFYVLFALVNLSSAATQDGLPNINKAQILICDNLFDSESGKWKGLTFVVFNEDKILLTSPSLPSGLDSMQRQRSKYCLPGLIDTHVHFEQTVTSLEFPFSHPDESFFAMKSVGYARDTLMAGFTTVRDLISDRNVAFNLRGLVELEERGEPGGVVGPSILATGSSFGPQDGHGDFFNKLKIQNRPSALEDYLTYYNKEFVSAVPEVSSWFHYYFDKKPKWYSEFPKVNPENIYPDAVKIMATGGVLSTNPNGHKAQLTQQVLDAAIGEVRSWRQRLGKPLPVAAHVHGFDGIEMVTRAGVDSIEHATELFVDINSEEKVDPERRQKVINEIKAKGIYVSPTLAAAQAALEIGSMLGGEMEQKAKVIAPKMLNSFSQLYDSELNIVFGSDTGVSAHGKNWHEFALMVAYSPMTPAEAIQTATTVAAESLGLENVGQIKRGFRADIIGFEQNPLEIIQRLSEKIDLTTNSSVQGEWPIQMVIKKGRRYM